jgi:hypothetical protein
MHRIMSIFKTKSTQRKHKSGRVSEGNEVYDELIQDLLPIPVEELFSSSPRHKLTCCEMNNSPRLDAFFAS